jgi:iron complex transport system permease protein
MRPRDRLVLAAFALAGLITAFALGMPGVSPWAWLADPDGPMARAFVQLQLPRVALGFVAGMVLAVAGTLMQAMLRNPLADPYILGVSGGAALGTATFGLGAAAAGAGTFLAIAQTLGGFAGALAALSLVLAFGRGPSATLRMVLAGIAVNAVAGAGLMVFAALADPGHVQRVLLRLMGVISPEPALPLLVPLVAVVGLVGVVVLLPSRRALDLLVLGDQTAWTLGVDTERLRRRWLLLVSCTVGAVVAATGLIGFVGLVVPHALRLALGPSHDRLLPYAAVVGGVATCCADALVSALAPAIGTELPVGVITALAGGPLFLWLLARHFRAGGVA